MKINFNEPMFKNNQMRVLDNFLSANGYNYEYGKVNRNETIKIPQDDFLAFSNILKIPFASDYYNPYNNASINVGLDFALKVSEYLPKL